MGKKNKFKLTDLVHKGYLSEGQTLYFVSDPSKTCRIEKQPNNEYKVVTEDGETTTIHAYATKCLGQDPPDHATKWFRDDDRKTLYDYWKVEEDLEEAA